MGGDDLGSDDELWTSGVPSEDNPNDSALDEAISVDTEGQKRKSLAEIDDNQNTKKKRKGNPEQLLLEAGRDLQNQDSNQQASFLNTALSHYNMLSPRKEEEIWKLQPTHFKTSQKETLVSRLNDSMALQRMKKWKEFGSPCVVSCRRNDLFKIIVVPI
jgi:hypothetical protein